MKPEPLNVLLNLEKCVDALVIFSHIGLSSIVSINTTNC